MDLDGFPFFGMEGFPVEFPYPELKPYKASTVIFSADEQGVDPITLFETHSWLVVSTHLKNISQIGSFPQVGVKIKNV